MGWGPFSSDSSTTLSAPNSQVTGEVLPSQSGITNSNVKSKTNLSESGSSAGYGISASGVKGGVNRFGAIAVAKGGTANITLPATNNYYQSGGGASDSDIASLLAPLNTTLTGIANQQNSLSNPLTAPATLSQPSDTSTQTQPTVIVSPPQASSSLSDSVSALTQNPTLFYGLLIVIGLAIYAHLHHR